MAKLAKRRLTAIDLFSGCGGLTQGLKTAGFNVICAVEIDDKARATYQMNHPDVVLAGNDIREISAEDLLEYSNLAVGELDLLAGCPPCQGFSTMRRKNRDVEISDSRNDLIDEFARMAFGLRPKLIMMENVPAIVKFPKFQCFVKDLIAEGYSVRYEVLDVAAYGVPQRRKRLILSANRISTAKLAEPLSGFSNVWNAIGALPQPGNSGDDVHDLPFRRSEKVQEIIRNIPKNGGSRSSLPVSLQLACHKRGNGFFDVYGRMSWSDVAPTITSGCTNPSKGRFLHPEQDRAITLREASILQGFPLDYRFNVAHGREAISLMIGNALPPSFISSHAKAMAKSINENN